MNLNGPNKSNKCSHPNCYQIFCRPHSSIGEETQVNSLLGVYRSFFDCPKIEKALNTEKALKTDQKIVDFYFYCVTIIYSTAKSEKFNPCVLVMKKQKALKSINPNNKKRTRRDTISVPSYEVEHTFCQITSQVFTPAEIYIAVGIVHLMLQKFHRAPNFLFGLIIVRLFNSLSSHASIDPSYFSIVYNVFNFVYHKITSSLVKLDLPDHEHCDNALCIFQLNFTKKDFKNSVESISYLLNQSEPSKIRSAQSNIFLLEIFKILFKLNQELDILSYESFYLKEYSDKIAMKEEYKCLKTKKETPIVYKFILPVAKKAELLKLENCDMQRNSLQDSFFRALFEGLTEPYLFISIRRDSIYADSLRILEETPNEDLKKQLKIIFIDEEGVDSGGIRKEFFQLLSHEIMLDESLFVHRSGTVWLRPNADLNKLKILGKIIGIALYNNVVLNIPFNSLIFKKFLNIKLNFSDLEFIEPEIYASFNNLEHVDESVFEDMDLKFVAEYADSKNNINKTLIKHGETIRVAKSNFHLFKELYARFYTSDIIVNEFTELLDGFYSVIIGESIEGFHYQELEKIIVGIRQIDFMEIKKACIYQGYTAEAKIIKDFWRIIDNLPYEKQKKLLQFVTGNNRLPIGGAKTLKFTIMKNGCDTDRLPSSQTCFNTLLLPEYSAYDKLEDKLITAIELTAGFFLM